MTFSRLAIALCLGGLAVACWRVGGSGADLVFRSGGVYTLDAERRRAEAVAVQDGRIVYVGPNEHVARFIGSRTETIDLTGRMLLPGLHDAHVHPILGSILETFCRLDHATTREATFEAVRACVASSSGDWVLAYGWRSSLFLPEVSPHKGDLDRIIPDRPAVLIAKDMHTFWLNSRALEAVGVTRETPTPAGGEILRDLETGEPTGALRDLAVEPVVKAIPRPGLIGSLRLLRATIQEMNRNGYTSFMEARLDRRDMAWAYRLLEWFGLLDARVSVAVLVDPREDLSQIEELRRLRDAFSTDRIQVRNAKIFVDGGTAFRAAASAPYADGQPSAEPYLEEAALTRYVTELDREGFSLHLHTLGDRATRMALDAIEAARNDNPTTFARHAVTHLVYPNPADLDRFPKLDVIANISPSWAFHNEWSASFLPTLGRERTAWLYPFRALSENGTLLTAGSDYPFTPLNPFLAIEVGMTRRDPKDPTSSPLVADQALRLEDLLAAYTINAAYQMHQEELTGSIEVGKAADLVVLDRDLFETPVDLIGETKVLMTLLAGQVVHRAESPARPPPASSVH
jgi:predicted amidohydrolase YtcJ